MFLHPFLAAVFGDIMTAMAQVIFFIFAAVMALFLISSVIVLFHFLHYRLQKNKHRGMTLAFLAGSTVLFFLELSMLLGADWDAIGEIVNGYLFRNSL